MTVLDLPRANCGTSPDILCILQRAVTPPRETRAAQPLDGDPLHRRRAGAAKVRVGRRTGAWKYRAGDRVREDRDHPGPAGGGPSGTGGLIVVGAHSAAFKLGVSRRHPRHSHGEDGYHRQAKKARGRHARVSETQAAAQHPVAARVRPGDVFAL